MSLPKNQNKSSFTLDLSQHHLNNSSSNQKFTFPKSSRFNSNKIITDSFYDLSNTRNGRSTSFGYGNKDIGLQKIGYTADPGSYEIKSQFDKHRRGSSFGVGREVSVKLFQQMAMGGPLRDSYFRKGIPGPGNYKVYSTLENKNITLKPRIPDRSADHAKKIPGPGTYNLEQLGDNKYYITSKYSNGTGSAKMTTKSSRISNINNKTDLGPGQYHPTQSDLKSDGRYILSKDKGSQSKVFSKSPRQQIVLKHLLGTPGPGSYSYFTQFGAV